jgi:O-antigen ligase
MAFEDTAFQWFVVFALLLEIVVFFEPAPVDAALVLCLGVGLLLGKLNFSAIDPLPVLGLAVFGVANLVSMYDPLDPVHALMYVLVTLYLAASWLFFAGVMGRYGTPVVGLMIRAYCLAGLASALLGVGGYFHLLPSAEMFLLNGRAKGLFKDCNVYGPYFVPMALFAVLRITDAGRSWRRKIGPAVLLVAALSAMLLSFSRACWINFGIATAVFAVGLLLFLSSPSERRQRLAWGAAVLVLGGVSAVLLVNLPAVSQMMAQRLTSSGLQNYDRVRFATQRLALEAAAERPLGLGPGQVEAWFDYSTHSMYLRVLSENGAVALVGVLVFIGATVARSVTLVSRAEDRWLREVGLVALASITGHLVNSFVIDTVHWRHIWFIYALPWAPARLLSSWRTRPLAKPFVNIRQRPAAAGFPLPKGYE